jgi:4-hydroxy-tetrahydrodipicolinate synthase
VQVLASLLTPFDKAGRVDLARLRAHVLWLSAQGVDGFVPTGVDGEFAYLADREREAVHRTVLDAGRGRQVWPFVWDANPATVAYLADSAREHGAAGVVFSPPLVYPLEDRVLRATFETLAGKGLAVRALHDPRTFASPVSESLFASLRAAQLVVGLHDASDDPYRVARLAAAAPGVVHAVGDRVATEVRGVPGLAGVVSSLVNVWPGFCLRLYRKGEHLDLALVDRVNRVRDAGGLRALKSLLRMGCRAPLAEPLDDALVGLPPSEAP